jgi:hypothetical protein
MSRGADAYGYGYRLLRLSERLDGEPAGNLTCDHDRAADAVVPVTQ